MTRPGPITSAPTLGTFFAFLWPMVLSNVLQSMSGTINNIYLGQMLGVRAMAAVSVFFPVLFFFIAFVIGLGAGSSVLIGQAYGAREPERVKAVAGTTLSVAFMLALAVGGFGFLFARPLLEAVGAPPDILDQSVSYAQVMFLGLPILFVFLLSTSMLRGVGDTINPMIALALSTVVGLIVTPALIRGWFGLPELGVASGGWAMIASLSSALGWLAWRLRRSHSPLAPDAALRRHLRIDRSLLLRVLRIGVPTGVQLVLMSLAEVAVLFLVNRFGSDATAAYGAVNQIVNYVQFPAISISITASILCAQAIGAGRAQWLNGIAGKAILLNLLLTGGLVALGYLFSRPMIGLFITSESVIELAQELLHIMLWSQVIFGMAGALSGVMRASGTVMVPMAISVASILAVELPLAWWLSQSQGLRGIWMAYPVAFSVMLALQASFFWFVWRRGRVLQRI